MTEVLIAMAISMVILVVVSDSYLSGLSASRLQSEETRLQESGRFALELVGGTIRRAGYRNTYALGSTAREFCSTSTTGSHFQSLDDPATVDPAAADLAGSSVAVANGSDVFRSRYYGEADGAMIDCLGQSVARGTLVNETLYVASDPANGNEPTLYCRSDNVVGVATAPLIAGVESLQLLLGEDTDGDGIINRFVPPGASGLNQDNVIGVRVSLVLRSPGEGKDLAAARVFDHFGDGLDTFNAPSDRRVRKMFSTQVAFRNFRQC